MFSTAVSSLSATFSEGPVSTLADGMPATKIRPAPRVGTGRRRVWMASKSRVMLAEDAEKNQGAVQVA